jgi:hypothetical protein
MQVAIEVQGNSEWMVQKENIAVTAVNEFIPEMQI